MSANAEAREPGQRCYGDATKLLSRQIYIAYMQECLRSGTPTTMKTS